MCLALDGESVLGLISFENNQIDAFSEEDQLFLEDLAEASDPRYKASTALHCSEECIQAI